MAKRKSGKDLRKEYQELLDKTKAMQKRFKKRADELIVQYPDVVYHKSQHNDDEYLTVGDYKKFYQLTPAIALVIIEKIEEYIASQHPHQQSEIDFDEPKYPDFIEYEDVDDNYKSPERTDESQVLEIRLYCMHDDFSCNKYIKGSEGYNGMFRAETGQPCDLRNQGFNCKEHR